MEETNDKIDSQCKICGQKFRFLKALRKHEMRHQGNGGFACRTCGMTFTTAALREKHRDKEHKILRCRICNIKFNMEPEYIYHINSLHNGRDRELCICSSCGKQFKTKSELTHHINSKCGTVKQYKCNICDQSLMNAGSLLNHMLKHNGKSYMCNYCAKTFATSGQLTVHERIHTQEKAFVCEVCNKGFCHRQSLITHSTIHTGIKPYQCEGCGKSFSCVGNLLKHRRTHKNTCAKVDLTSHRVQNPATKMKVLVNTPPNSKLKKQEMQKKILLATEIVTKQNSDVNSLDFNSQNILEENNTNVFEDKEVTILYNNTQQLNNQEELNKVDEIILPKNEDKYTNKTQTEDSKIENFDHNKCDSPLSIKKEDNIENYDWINDNYDNFSDDISDDSLDLMTRKCKSENIKIEDNLTEGKPKTKCKKQKNKINVKKIKNDGETFSCKYCETTYTNVGWLMKHELKCPAVKKTKGFKCSCCSMVFETKEDCSNHQQFSHADILTCKDCKKTFSNPDSLKAHTKYQHSGVPRRIYLYVCDICGRGFKQRALLSAHKGASCRDLPRLPCPLCDKLLASKYVLQQHMKLHQPHKSVLCSFCGKSFRWKGQLKVHERTHTAEKPYKCTHCPKSFAYRESLITHNTLHTGIKPHVCEACGSRFSCIGNLLKHQRTHAATCGPNAKPKDTTISP